MSDTIHIKKTDSANADFIYLIEMLNFYLARENGDKHAFFDQFNQVDKIRNVVVLYVEGKPVACGAFKEFESDTVEIKRMFVLEQHRRQGHSKKVLEALHTWAKEIGYAYAVLETARRFDNAVGLYTKAGYTVIPNYGPYEGVEESICMKFTLC